MGQSDNPWIVSRINSGAGGMTKTEDNRDGEYGRKVFEDLWSSFSVPIVDDDPGYHSTQLFPRADKVLIRRPSVDYGKWQSSSRCSYLYKDYGKNISVLFEVRSQLGSGSTDSKLVDIVDSLLSCEFSDCCLVLIGNGFRRTVRVRVHERVREMQSANKRIKIVNAVGNVLQRQIDNLIQNGRLQ